MGRHACQALAMTVLIKRSSNAEAFVVLMIAEPFDYLIYHALALGVIGTDNGERVDQLFIASHMPQKVLNALVAELACKIEGVALQYILLACDEVARRDVVDYLGVLGVGVLRHALVTLVVSVDRARQYPAQRVAAVGIEHTADKPHRLEVHTRRRIADSILQRLGIPHRGDIGGEISSGAFGDHVDTRDVNVKVHQLFADEVHTGANVVKLLINADVGDQSVFQ